MILDDIFENRKRQVELKKRERTMSQIEKEVQAYCRAHKTKDFAAALRGDTLSVIAEVKKASPSRGVICADFDPLAIAKKYEMAGAAAISVLTEETYFQGRIGYLEMISRKVPLPILMKDFIFDEWQICEARLVGADAILLIAAMLSSDRLKQLLNYAKAVGLAALVETHDEAEVAAAVEAGAEIYGVNNRNLRDFSIDTDCACRLSEFLPKEAVFVAESGIKNREDAEKMRGAGADAILVGEALVTADDLNEKLKELRVK